MKLKKNNKFVVAADGSAASGKTTGARIISKKYGLQFLSSGLLYRFASYQLLRAKPKNKIKFLKSKFKNLNYNKITKINLHSSKISEHTSIIAKQKKIRNILKKFQRDFASKHKRVCIEGRDIGTVILPKADLKVFNEQYPIPKNALQGDKAVMEYLEKEEWIYKLWLKL